MRLAALVAGMAGLLAVTSATNAAALDPAPLVDAFQLKPLAPTGLIPAQDPVKEAPAPPEPVTVPANAVLVLEGAPVVVTPKPPPPPAPPVAQSRAESHSSRVARAAAAPNGEIPPDALCSLSWDASARLRCDAAAGLEDAATAGMPRVAMTSTYRTIADQHAVKASRGSFAATPGTSNHGHGVAVDIPQPARSWLARNGEAFGWVNPRWARGYEPWHFEFAS